MITAVFGTLHFSGYQVPTDFRPGGVKYILSCSGMTQFEDRANISQMRSASADKAPSAAVRRSLSPSSSARGEGSSPVTSRPPRSAPAQTRTAAATHRESIAGRSAPSTVWRRCSSIPTPGVASNGAWCWRDGYVKQEDSTMLEGCSYRNLI